MKILTVLGTRPEIIRLSRIIAKLDKISNHILVNTGQNFDTNLSDIFFDQMGVRRPDYELNVSNNNFAHQIAAIMTGCEQVFETEKPDRLLILGDTNSSLSAYIAKRMGIPVFHMEAGNRCYDDRVPEEINRRVIDHSSDVHMPYTERSRQNLKHEGIQSDRIFVTGNPIFEVITHYSNEIAASSILLNQNITPQNYFLVTLHRAENVDLVDRFTSIIEGLRELQVSYDIPIIISTHPRTLQRIQEFNIDITGTDIRFAEPFGFFDFIKLEKNALCVLSDSGTVQEECAIFGIPNVTIRDVTERPETIECGSNILSGPSSKMIQNCVQVVLKQKPTWYAPHEYLKSNMSNTVVKILTGYHRFLN
ncbi:MAG: UDP-N-acetylglucosamine 2-epimerase (non-hydrolyzing) [Methylocystaceae bacterium]|nr:UDP-N-acetylglucosamine 2-epimerase (non-hydrolyzing) [Methylocystaceae bacterium]